MLYQPSPREYAIENPLLGEWLAERQPQLLGFIAPFVAKPPFEDAIPAGQYTGLIQAVDGERILQHLGDGRVLLVLDLKDLIR